MEFIRPLRATDKEDVLEIARRTWDGHDYLPYSFDSWINDANSHTAAVEYDGTVIALANLRVIENGKTGWMEGLRVHSDYRGKGLASTLTNHILQLATNIPVERVRYTTATGNETSLHLGKSVGMKRMFDLAIHWQELGNISPRGSSNSSIQVASPSEIYPDLIDANLVPHNVFVYDWKALDITAENLHKIGLLSKFWTQRSDDALTSISIGFIRNDAQGPQWSFTIYAKDIPSFLDQIAFHLNLATEHECSTIFGTYQMEFIEMLYALDWVQPHEEEKIGLTLLERVL